MADFLLCASFVLILFIPCVLATRSARRPDLSPPPALEAAVESEFVPPYPVARPLLRPTLVPLPPDPARSEWSAASGDFGELQMDYERYHQRLVELCAAANQVA